MNFEEAQELYKFHQAALSEKINELTSLKTKKQTLESVIAKNQAQIVQVENEIKTSEMVSKVLQLVASQSREKAASIFEQVVTDALQFSTQDPSIRFVIENLGTRVKPAYEFYIETETLGVKSKKDITSGGYRDICANTLSFVYCELFNDPKIMNCTMLLDEPNKMTSGDIDFKFAEYLKFICKQYAKVPIMITHKEQLEVVADRCWKVTLINGISNVTLVPVGQMPQIIDIEKDTATTIEAAGGLEDVKGSDKKG